MPILQNICLNLDLHRGLMSADAGGAQSVRPCEAARREAAKAADSGAAGALPW